MNHDDFTRHGTITAAKPLRSRSGAQRAIDYLLAYGGGPVKLGRFPSHDLREALDRYTEALVYADLSALEQALQDRIDEEGCGAFFAATLYPHSDVNCVARPDRMSKDNNHTRHSDMRGDISGDAVTCVIVDEQGVSSDAADLGSGDFYRGGSSPSTRTSQ